MSAKKIIDDIFQEEENHLSENQNHLSKHKSYSFDKFLTKLQDHRKKNNQLFKNYVSSKQKCVELYESRLDAESLYRHKDEIYNAAKALLEEGKYLKALEKFNSIKNHRDANELAKECIKKLDEIYNQAYDCYNRKDYEKARDIFQFISGHKDSKEMANKCQNLLNAIANKDEVLNKGLQAYQNNKYLEALNIFKTIPGHRNADELIEKCTRKLDEIYDSGNGLFAEGKYQEAKDIFFSIKPYKDTTSLIEKCNEKIVWLEHAEKKYKEGLTEFNKKNYVDAFNRFNEIYSFKGAVIDDTYKDSKEYISKCQNILDGKYTEASNLFNAGEYQKASVIFRDLKNYKDSQAKYEACIKKIKDAEREKTRRKEARLKGFLTFLLVLIIIAATALTIGLAIVLFSNKLQIMAVSNYGGWVFGWVVLLLLSIAAIFFSIVGIVYLQSDDQFLASVIVFFVSLGVLGLFGGIGFGNATKLKPNFNASTLLEFSVTSESRYYDTVTMEFSVTNTSNYAITYFKGDMLFYNNSNYIKKYYVDCKGSFEGNETRSMKVDFYSAESISNIPFDSLGVTYKLTKIKFKGEATASIKGTTMVIKDNGNMYGGDSDNNNNNGSDAEPYYADGILGTIQRYVNNNQVVIPDDYIKYSDYETNYRYYSYSQVSSGDYSEYDACRLKFYKDISEYSTFINDFCSKLSDNGFTQYFKKDYQYAYDEVEWECEYRKGSLVIEFEGPNDGDQVYNSTYLINNICIQGMHY